MAKQILKLVRRNLPTSYPEVGDIIKPTVPLGKEYEIIGFQRDCLFYNEDIDKKIVIDCYITRDANGERKGGGLMPVEVFGD